MPSANIIENTVQKGLCTERIVGLDSIRTPWHPFIWLKVQWAEIDMKMFTSHLWQAKVQSDKQTTVLNQI